MHWFGMTRSELYYKTTWAEIKALHDDMELQRYIESLPTLMLDYHQHLRGTGFGKPRKISFTQYHAHLIPESVKHSTTLAVYSPDEVRSFTIAMKRGLVSNAALAAYDLTRMRASGYGSRR